MKKLYQILKRKKLTISFAESMTGGYLSSKLSMISGASQVFNGAIIAYSNLVKIRILNVSDKTINNYSVVSKNVSEEMAKGLIKQIPASIYISVTGNAGPKLQENTNKFNAFYTIIKDDTMITEEVMFESNNRLKNIKKIGEIITLKIIKILED